MAWIRYSYRLVHQVLTIYAVLQTTLYRCAAQLDPDTFETIFPTVYVLSDNSAYFKYYSAGGRQGLSYTQAEGRCSADGGILATVADGDGRIEQFGMWMDSITDEHRQDSDLETRYPETTWVNAGGSSQSSNETVTGKPTAHVRTWKYQYCVLDYTCTFKLFLIENFAFLHRILSIGVSSDPLDNILLSRRLTISISL